jgi:hypothetical protein
VAVNYSTGLRNAQLEAIETVLLTGGNPRLYLYTGTKPANCATADPSGSIHTTGADMGSNPFQVAANGQIALAGPLTFTLNPGGNGVQSFRIKDGAGTCHIQGTVSTAAADLVLNKVNFSNGESLTIAQLVITAANA